MNDVCFVSVSISCCIIRFFRRIIKNPHEENSCCKNDITNSKKQQSVVYENFKPRDAHYIYVTYGFLDRLLSFICFYVRPYLKTFTIYYFSNV
jgi:hypothetical protein